MLGSGLVSHVRSTTALRWLVLAAALGIPAIGLAAPGDLDPTFNGGNVLLLDLAPTASNGTALRAARFDSEGRIVVAGSTTDADLLISAALARLMPDGSLDPTFGDGGTTVVQAGRGSGMIFSSIQSLVPRAGGGWAATGSASASDGREASLVLAVDADGDPDLDFGLGGSTRAQLAGASPARTLAFGGGGNGGADADGNLVLGHAITNNVMGDMAARLVVARFTSGGDLDDGFATTGVYTNTFSQSPSAVTTYGFAALPTDGGRVVFCGTTLDQNAHSAFLVGRLTSEGDLDGTFANGLGYRVLQVSHPAAVGPSSQALGMAVGPDGRIYLVGPSADAESHSAFTVARFSEDGVLDTGYGTGGVARVQTATADPGDTPAGFPYGIAVQSDGSVLAIGGSGSERYTEIAVLRLTPDGDPDPSFGTGGIVRIQPAMGAEPETFGFGITIAPDGHAALALGQMRAMANGRGVVAKILLTDPPTTTTTIPDPCAPVGSLTNALCALDQLSAAVTANVPPSRLHDRLVGFVGKSRTAAAATTALTGKPRRKSFKRALVALKKVQLQLKSKKARRAIPEDARAALATQALQITATLTALRDAS